MNQIDLPLMPNTAALLLEYLDVEKYSLYFEALYPMNQQLMKITFWV